MKLLSLDLLAYGLFSGKTLNFGGHKTDFHVVFGGNEAGKSTSLRALLALLYGVPARTRDSFLHATTKLRVGGRLQHSSGKELEFRRRKGNKNTLLDTHDAAIDDSSLRDFLAGIDRARFEAMFGIDHERLAKGAQAILSGGGDVGESLFSAGVGTANLREVLNKFDAEADDLYKSRGNKPKINSGLSAYKASVKKVREATLLSSGWSKQRTQLVKLQEQQKELATIQSQLKTEATRLSRLQGVLPKLARRDSLRSELQPLDEVLALADDFAERRRAAEQTLRQAVKTYGDAERELSVKRREVNELDVPEELLDEQVAVNDLFRTLGSIQKGEDDAEKLKGRSAVLRAAAHVLLESLPTQVKLDDIDEIRPKANTKARVRELAELYQATSADPTHAKRDVTRCERELKADQDALDALDRSRPVAPLRQLVARLRKRGELEHSHRSAVRVLADTVEEAALALKGLSLWTGSLEECEALAVPGRETVEHHRETMREALSTITSVAAAIKTCKDSLAEQDETVDALKMAGDVVTETDLQDARGRRTDDWLRIRQAWLGEPAPAGTACAAEAVGDLPASYEGHVEKADEYADRLRREAKRVAKFAELEAHRIRLQGELHQLELERDAAADGSDAATAAWEQVWAPLGVTPLSPAEMQSWLDSYARVVTLAKTAREEGRRVETLQQDIDTLGSKLSAALEAIGESAMGERETLSSSLDRADLFVEVLTETTRRRGELETGIPARAKALENARDVEGEAVTALKAWRVDWAAAVSELGLEGAASPTEANAVLDKLNELFEKFDEARATKGRLNGISRNAEAFATEAAKVVQRAAPDLLGRPTNQAVESLHERLASAKADKATLRELHKRIKDLDATIADSEAEQKRAETDLETLCGEAGCEQTSELAATERQSDHKAELKGKLVTLEDQITELGGGAAVDALVSEAEAIDPDALPAQIDEIGRNSAALDEQRSVLDKQIGSEESDFERLDGSDAAAEATAHAELAKLGTLLDRYVRVKLAAKLLRDEIERYREENQGPLLKRAGQIFSTLTLGSFSDLGADYNDKDEPVLVGVRPNDERVNVGGMSDGTADQLYLSIRLATLEQHLATHEPLPFVVDDILVQFDDARARAALKVLAELSKKTQVLFFTHHTRLVELAKELGDGVAAIHNL